MDFIDRGNFKTTEYTEHTELKSPVSRVILPKSGSRIDEQTGVQARQEAG